MVWEKVSLPPQGKITLSDLRVFRVNFLSAQRGVLDVGAGEARCHLLNKLPTFLGERIFKKEVEKTRTSKRVHVNPGKHVPPERCEPWFESGRKHPPGDGK